MCLCDSDESKQTQYLAAKFKCMVTLATMFVLSEYLTSENGQHSVGKLRVRGVQIVARGLSKVLNHTVRLLALLTSSCIGLQYILSRIGT